MRKPPPGAAPAAAARRPDRRVTSYDVARLAGVSQSAVSRCFKPGASISKDTRARVMKAARRLDYVPNAAARSLITRRSNLVAVIVSSAAHPSKPELLSELSRQLARRGKRALLFSVAHDHELDAALAAIWQFQIDGAIAATALSDAQVAQFARRRVPLLGFDACARGQALNAVVCDHAEAAIGCLDTARHALGIHVPGRMSVAGCNATDASAWPSQQLTTLRQPVQRMAQAAADLLAELMESHDAAPQRRVFGAELVEGATARLHAPRDADLARDADVALRMALNQHGLVTL